MWFKPKLILLTQPVHPAPHVAPITCQLLRLDGPVLQVTDSPWLQSPGSPLFSQTWTGSRGGTMEKMEPPSCNMGRDHDGNDMQLRTRCAVLLRSGRGRHTTDRRAFHHVENITSEVWFSFGIEKKVHQVLAHPRPAIPRGLPHGPSYMPTICNADGFV